MGNYVVLDPRTTQHSKARKIRTPFKVIGRCPLMVPMFQI
jgi:hypothetical protein